MKGKNFKKGKVSSHLEQSPPHSHVARTTTHVWAHRTDSPHACTLTGHAPVQHSWPDVRAHTQTPHTLAQPIHTRTHTHTHKGASTTKEVEEKCYP